MKVARGGWSHILVGVIVAGLGIFSLSRDLMVAGSLLLVAGLLVIAFMVYFFRDPERSAPAEQGVIVSGADGWVRSVELISEARYLKRDTVRISTYLTPWDVHVNRCPIGGKVVQLDYTPGQHILTRNPKSSEVNEHSTIVIQGNETICMVRQIVGPLVRRVKYWLKDNQSVSQADRLGIMKFGSRLDIYLPVEAVTPTVKAGDRVFAGITVVARIKKG